MTWDTVTLDENNTGVTGRTGNHTIGSGFKRWVAMIIWGGGSGVTVSGTPTFGGSNMTLKASFPFSGSPIFGNVYFYELVNPTSGVNAWAVNFTGTVMPTVILISRDEMNQSTPSDAVDTDTNANHVSSTSATTATENGDVVIDIVVTGGGVAAGVATVSGTGQVILAQSVNTGENHFTGVSYSPATEATLTQTWDLSPVGGDLGLYQLQINLNTDATAPVPPADWNLRQRVQNGRPRPFAPGRIR